MKKLLMFLVLGMFVLTPINVQAVANDKAYEHANDQAIFNRVGDWFATAGKSDTEKMQIKAERKAKRAAKQAEKEVRKLEKKANKKTAVMKENMKEHKGSK